MVCSEQGQYVLEQNLLEYVDFSGQIYGTGDCKWFCFFFFFFLHKCIAWHESSSRPQIQFKDPLRNPFKAPEVDQRL